MTDHNLGPIIADAASIKRELARRRSTQVFKTVTGSTLALVNQKVQLELKDGWEVAKRNKRSVRIAKDKPPDELLEDEIWTVLAQMGFQEMSEGRNFQVSMGPNLSPRQIDVFAKDDEVALVVECTQKDHPGRKSMDYLIQKLSANREAIHEAVVAQYGRQAKLRVKYVIATRNISWSQADLDRCEDSEISVISDTEIDYYSALVQHLKHAARFQLLAHLFGGSSVRGLANTVVATRGKMGGDTFYAFLIRPDELLKIAYVGHRASRTVDNIRTYQRMLQPKRLKRISEFINAGGKFPTNIVVNLKTQRNKQTNRNRPLRFEEKQKIGDESFGVLHLPAQYASAWIIDGQHRLYGYAYARTTNGFNHDHSTVPVLAYENLPAEKEMNLFIDINSKQVRVTTSLLMELYSELHWDSQDPREAFQALLSRLASRLNSDPTSPLFDRVIVSGKKKTSHRCLTQTSLRDGLLVARLLGSLSQDVLLPGPLSTPDVSDYEGNLRKSFSVLTDCLRVLSEGLPDHWKRGNAPGGYLCTNNGLRALFHVIADITHHVHSIKGTNLCHLDPDAISQLVSPYLDPLVTHFKTASSQQVQAFRAIGSSLTAVKQQSHGLEVHIHTHCPTFNPPELRQYLASRDQAGTESAARKVTEIHRRLFEYVIDVLKDHHGERDKRWWIQGIPLKIRQQCTNEWEAQDRRGSEESHLHLISYIEICLRNWDLVKDVVSLDQADKINKKRNTKWIKDLNDIRQITSHPERGILDTDQVRFVDETHDKVTRFFPERPEGS